MKPIGECLCGSGKNYNGCCEPYLKRVKHPLAPEALMRSRYCAYVLGDEAYLLETWHVSKRPPQLDLSSDRATKWLGLKIINVPAPNESEGTVEFVARYKINGRAHRLHEVSHFVRENGVWFYLDGEHGR